MDLRINRMNRFAFRFILFAILGFFSTVNADGPFQLAPAIETIIQAVNRNGNPLDSLTAEALPGLRQNRETLAKNILGTIPVEEIRNISVPADHQIPIRIYKPLNKVPASNEGLPILVFLRGGGWTLGSISTILFPVP
jgi:acetyl esterase